MSKQSLYIILILLTTAVGTFFFNKECNCSQANVVNTDTFIKVKTMEEPQGLFAIEGSGYNYSCNGNIVYAYHTANHAGPIPECANIGLDNLKFYLQTTPLANVYIEGYALAQEKNNTTYPNLGVARAEEIKNYLVSRGYSANRIYTSGGVAGDLSYINESLMTPLKIRVNNGNAPTSTTTKPVIVPVQTIQPNDNPKVVAPVSAGNIVSTLTLNYSPNTTKIFIDANQDAKLASMVKMVLSNNSSKIKIVTNCSAGASCNQGNFAKDFFVANKITSSRVTTESNTTTGSNNTINISIIQ